MLEAKSVWACIRAHNNHSEFDPEEDLKDWTMVNLNHPLRTPRNISENVKDVPQDLELHGLGNDFNSGLRYLNE